MKTNSNLPLIIILTIIIIALSFILESIFPVINQYKAIEYIILFLITGSLGLLYKKN